MIEYKSDIVVQNKITIWTFIRLYHCPIIFSKYSKQIFMAVDIIQTILPDLELTGENRETFNRKTKEEYDEMNI